jgi:AcrR family transcriptional regulator
MPTIPEPANQPGLRERKKQATRRLIGDTARRLFVERGFERVSVAEVARAADVSEKTVFNYFPRKEDLIFWRFESFEEELLAAVRGREVGESVLAGFGRFVLQRRGLLADQDAEARALLVGVTRMISESPALLAREQQIFARYTLALAGLIAEETGAEPDDLEPWVTANALIGVHRSLVYHAREWLLADAHDPRIGPDVLAGGRRALAALDRGLGDYAIRR